MATAIPIESAERPQTIERGTAGTARATRWYYVDASDPAAAVEADGLPADGAAWDGSSLGARLKRVRLVATPAGGYTQTGGVGWCFVRAEYETVGWGGGRPDPKPMIGGDYTELLLSQDSQQVFLDINGDGPPINNGAGVSRLIGRAGLRVHLFKTHAQFLAYPFDQMLDTARQCAVNQDEVILPPLLQIVPMPTFSPGTLRFRGPSSMQPVGDLVEIILELDWSINFLEVWNLINEEGSAEAQIASEIYPSMDIAALFV